MATNLREANTNVFAEGILAEKNLKVEANGKAQLITGTLTIKVSDTDTIAFRVRQASLKSDGKGGYKDEENKVYTSLKTVMDEYKSIAEVGEEQADKIRVANGQLAPYFNPNSSRETMGYRATFFNRVSPDRKYEPKAQFDVELFVTSIAPEVYTNGDKQGEETGRAVVKGWMPTYNGIEPVELVAPKEDGIAEAILGDEAYQPGITTQFSGNIINRRIEKTVETPVRIGKPKITTTVSYTNELVITGVLAPYTEDDNVNTPYDKDAIKAAIAEREAKNAEAVAKAKNNSHNSSNASSKPASSGRSLPW